MVITTRVHNELMNARDTCVLYDVVSFTFVKPTSEL